MARGQILLHRIRIPVLCPLQRALPRLRRAPVFFRPGLARRLLERGEDLVLGYGEGGDEDVAVRGRGVVGGAQEVGDGEADGGEGGHAAGTCAGVVDHGGAGGEGEGEEVGGEAPV